jgi:AraC-like DNA-binding protein
MLDAWLELLGGAGEFEISQCGLSRMKSLRSALSSIARTSPLKAEWRIHGLLTEAWGELLAVSSRLPGASSLASAPVQRVVDAVLARPDYPWQAGEMASLAGTSYSSLRAAFKAARGESVHSFLQQVRLDQARAWLADLRVPIKEVSARLHFRSETYFASWFRNLTGHPPGLHRRHLRG